jgi:hypothetical protein
MPWGFRSHHSSSCVSFARKCDGFVCISSSVYELEALKALRKWLVETGNRGLYVVGPLLPHGFGNVKLGALSGAQSFELAMSEKGGETQEFLESIMKTHGKQSLVYVSRSRFCLSPSCIQLFAPDFFRKLLVAPERHCVVIHKCPPRARSAFREFILFIACAFVVSSSIRLSRLFHRKHIYLPN